LARTYDFWAFPFWLWWYAPQGGTIKPERALGPNVLAPPMVVRTGAPDQAVLAVLLVGA